MIALTQQHILKVPWPVWLGVALVALAVYTPLTVYIAYDFSLLLTFLLAPFIIYIPHRGVLSWRCGWFTGLLLTMYAITGVLTALYFAVCTLLLLIVERYWGRVNWGAFVLLVLSGSITRYFIGNIGFPLRLQLSEWAGGILRYLDASTEVFGNVIIFRDAEYLVDPACMGVNMVVTGLVLSLALIRYFELRYTLRFSIWGLAVLLLFALGLVAMANLFRILALVITGYPPYTVGHEAVGLLSLAIYVLLPVAGLLWLLAKKKWLIAKDNQPEPTAPKAYPIYPVLLLCAAMTWFGFTYQPQANYVKDSPYLKLTLPGYEAKLTKLDVLQLSSDSGLIYIKPPANFYGSDHSPYICWSGSGYVFKQMQEVTIAGTPMYTARLEFKQDTLYTAWWFSNGEQRTVEQLVWRTESLRGRAPFALVNVTSTSPEKLEAQIRVVMEELCL